MHTVSNVVISQRVVMLLLRLLELSLDDKRSLTALVITFPTLVIWWLRNGRLP